MNVLLPGVSCSSATTATTTTTTPAAATTTTTTTDIAIFNSYWVPYWVLLLYIIHIG